jgi:hypothetical protein
LRQVRDNNSVEYFTRAMPSTSIVHATHENNNNPSLIGCCHLSVAGEVTIAMSSSSNDKATDHAVDVDDYESQDGRSGSKIAMPQQERDEATLHDEEEENHARAAHGTDEEHPTRRRSSIPMEVDHGQQNYHASNQHNHYHHQDHRDHREIFVDEDDDDDDELTCLSWGWFWCLFWLALLAMTVGVSCRIHGCNASSDPVQEQPAQAAASPVQSPTMAITPAPTPETLVISGLPTSTMQALQDPASAQAQAYRWLAKDPVLARYSNPRRIQRFALATLYYATNGTHWVDKNWLLYETNECTWFTHTDARVYPEYETEYNSYPCSPESEYMFLTPWNNGMSGTLPPELGLLR